MDTVASNPGQIRPRLGVWLGYYKRGAAILTFLCLGVLALMAVSFWFVVALPFLGFIAAVRWERTQQHFRQGDCNPGMVLQENPLRMAIATNLTTGAEPFPVLKVVDYGFALKEPAAPKVGDIIPTMSLYASDGSPSPRHWINFEPIPVHCATDDSAEIAAVASRLNPESIAFLTLLKSRSPSLEPGLYWFNAETMQPMPAPTRKG